MKLFVYTLKVKDARDPKNIKTWDKYKGIYNGRTFDLTISHECAKKLAYEVKEFPVTLTISDKDYFVKREHYVTKDGRKGSKLVIAILGYDAWEPAEFEKRTIDDYIAEDAKEAK